MFNIHENSGENLIGIKAHDALYFVFYLFNCVAFFIGWEYWLGQYDWARDSGFWASINAPVLDFVAVGLVPLLLLALVFSASFRPTSDRLKIIFWPVIIYGIFLLWALFSWRYVYDSYFGASLKYWLRFMVWPLIAYLIVPFLFIRSRAILETVLRIWFWAGVFIALFGLSSLFFGPTGEWWRVTPYALWGWAPMGYNQNLLAEALAVILPAAVYLGWGGTVIARPLGRSNPIVSTDTMVLIYRAGAILMSLVMLLTLSRAAWLSALAVIVIYLYQRRPILSAISPAVKITGTVIMVSLLAYLAVFIFSPTSLSSNASRYDAAKVAWFYTLRSPWLGYGPGMYINVLTDTRAYVLDYGEPLDGHGFITKILLEDGFVGLALFCIFLIAVLWIVTRALKNSGQANRPLLWCLLLTVVGAIVFQLFNTSYFAVPLWLPLGVALAGATTLKH